MESVIGILEGTVETDDVEVPLKADNRIIKNNQNCQKEELISTLEGNISLCRCGIYHVRINTTALYFNEAQFKAAARLFKLALGMMAGRRLYPLCSRMRVGTSASAR